MTRKTKRKSAVTFNKRTADIYNGQKRRAIKHGEEIPYTLEEYRESVRDDLSRGKCWYCYGPIDWRTYQSDHAIPISRGGFWGLKNLLTCCESCNGAKGSMTFTEFNSLLAMICDWPAEIRENTLARLRAGHRARMRAA